MKKILLMAAGVVFATPFFVSAQTATSIDQFTQGTQVQSSCIDLKYNLGYRSRDARTNGEVSELQDFFVANGYLSGSSTGYFGAATLMAVKKFQSVALIATSTTPGYGRIGPKSRAKIKELSCSLGTTTTTATTAETTTTTPTTSTAVSVSASTATSPASAITVLSPNGGEKWEAGKTYTISWKSTGLKKPLKINLYRNSDTEGGFVYEITTVNPDLLTGMDSYNWTIPYNIIQDTYIIVLTSDFPDEFKINKGMDKYLEDSSDMRFAIISNTPPAIINSFHASKYNVNSGETIDFSWSGANISEASEYKLHFVISNFDNAKIIMDNQSIGGFASVPISMGLKTFTSAKFYNTSNFPVDTQVFLYLHNFGSTGSVKQIEIIVNPQSP